MTRIAYGCDTTADLIASMASRAEDGRLRLLTKRRPRRAEEILGGGSLYWIVKHQLVARAPIIAFEEAEEARWHIVLDAAPRLVVPQGLRAHQGWRYLALENAPPDLVSGEAAVLPARMSLDLAELGLL